MSAFVRELFQFMRARRKFWLLPLVMLMLLLGLLMVFTQEAVAAPFIYTMF